SSAGAKPSRRSMAWLANSRVPSGATRATASAPCSIRARKRSSPWRRASSARACSVRARRRSRARTTAGPTRSRWCLTTSSATSSTIRTRTTSGISSARLLVQEQPVEPDLGDGAREGLEVHRLDDVAVGTEAVRRGDVGLFLGRGEHDDRQRARALLALKASQHLQPVHFRELQVEQNHTRRDADLAQRMALLAEEEFQRLGPVAGDEHLIRQIPGLEGAQSELHVARVVLDQQDLD